nr:HlyD family efflux transporter periplasmic adaptor subunit [Bradyrhizobium sp. CCBAU 65884]
MAEIYVSPKDIGFVQMGQAVRLQVDVFNHNQWGGIDAKVLNVAQDFIVLDKRLVFKVRCALSRTGVKMPLPKQLPQAATIPIPRLRTSKLHEGFLRGSGTIFFSRPRRRMFRLSRGLSHISRWKDRRVQRDLGEHMVAWIGVRYGASNRKSGTSRRPSCLRSA